MVVSAMIRLFIGPHVKIVDKYPIKIWTNGV